MGRTVRTLAVAAVAVATALPAMAASNLAVEMNHSRRVLLPGTVANVIVSNPTIADATVIDSHSIIVLGRGYGQTDVIATDRTGHVLFDSQVTVVEAQRGVVTVHNGPLGVDFSCAPRCEAVAANTDAVASSSANSRIPTIPASPP